MDWTHVLCGVLRRVLPASSHDILMDAADRCLLSFTQAVLQREPGHVCGMCPLNVHRLTAVQRHRRRNLRRPEPNE